jgi:nitroimidazol reductase NimA-like FMN-containing flavoprotein (pyridoxamine 5'-phosphate oxidase superfamily)
MAKEKRRAPTQMTANEIDAFLDSQRTLILVTLRKDGSPVAHPLWFAKLGDALYINTRRDSLKIRNVSHDARVCAVIEDGESYFELRGVRVEGSCEEVTDDDEIARAQEAQSAKDERIGSGMREMPAWFAESREKRLGQGDRLVLRIPMERVHSWDFSKVRSHYARGPEDPTEEKSS